MPTTGNIRDYLGAPVVPHWFCTGSPVVRREAVTGPRAPHVGQHLQVGAPTYLDLPGYLRGQKHQ